MHENAQARGFKKVGRWEVQEMDIFSRTKSIGIEKLEGSTAVGVYTNLGAILANIPPPVNNVEEDKQEVEILLNEILDLTWRNIGWKQIPGRAFLAIPRYGEGMDGRIDQIKNFLENQVCRPDFYYYDDSTNQSSNNLEVKRTKCWGKHCVMVDGQKLEVSASPSESPELARTMDMDRIDG